MEHEMKVIAHIHSDFSEKFGIPRQSGLVESLQAQIVFTPAYRDPEALRGIEEFSHLWLIWQFSEFVREWSPTVRPPRLGGNARMGVFATRSPHRPNPLGLSCVKFERVEKTAQGPVLLVSGADLMDGTPIYDIKPYLPYSDCKSDARSGFAPERAPALQVEVPQAFAALLPAEKLEALRGVLAQDPRPSYHRDPAREYGMRFAGFEVHFQVEDGVVRVKRIEKAPQDTQP